MGNAPALAAFAAPADCRRLKHPWGDVWKAGEPSEHLETLTLGGDLGDNRLLTCTGYYHVRLRRRYYTRRENPPFLAVEMVARGQIGYGDGAQRLLAEAGDVCLLHPGRVHELSYAPGEVAEKHGLVFTGPLLETALAGLGLSEVFRVRVDQERAREFRDAIAGWMRQADAPLARHHLAGAAVAFLHFLAAHGENRPLPPLAAAAVRALEARAGEDVAMRELAASLHVTLPTLNRAVAAVTGFSPYQYLIRVRMRRALALLGQRRWQIKEIARQVGYKDPLHFSAEFRRLYGRSPRAYAAELAATE